MTDLLKSAQDIATLFAVAEPIRQLTPFGNGHINDTFLVDDGSQQYVLQRISPNAFPYPEKIMENMEKVTRHLINAIRTRGGDPARETLHVIPLKSGLPYYRDPQGHIWRMTLCIPDTISIDLPEHEDMFRESGRAFGMFAHDLDSFPAASLFETIARFHDTPNRVRAFEDAVLQDSEKRLSSVMDLVRLYQDREHRAHELVDALESGALPLRVTHNDTKLNNVLLDPVTRKALCVLDLDTVMPGSVLFDFGDAIRSGASTVAEDAMDLSQVGLDLHLFNIYLDGFLNSCPSLTHKEIEMLPLGVLTMTVELASRFLTDYLEGDHYFKIDHRDHNLIRARAQIRLAQDIAVKMDSMNEKVSNCVSRQKTELILNAK